MPELIKVLFIIVMTINAWIALSLCLENTARRNGNRWLGGLLFSLEISLGYFYCWYLSIPAASWLGLSCVALLWTKGPFLMCFLGLSLKQSVTKPYRHYMPACAVLVLVHSFPMYWPILAIMGLAHGLCYLALSLRRVFVYRTEVQLLAEEFKNTAHYWYLCIAVGLAVILISDTWFIKNQITGVDSSSNSARWMSICLSIYLIGTAVFSLYRPNVFYKRSGTDVGRVDKHSEESADERVCSNTLERGDAQNNVVRYKSLSPELSRQLLDQLNVLMTEQSLFLDNALTRQELAEQMGITSHHLSELLNIPPYKGFYHYLNTLRLEYACRLLKSQDCDLRILDIAFESGFNNKNSFYRAFSERFHTTPQKYRQSYQEKTFETA